MLLSENLIYMLILFIDISMGENTINESLLNKIHRPPKMYIRSVLGYPVLLFADAILGDECITWTSRYNSDGRKNYLQSKLVVHFNSLNSEVNEDELKLNMKRIQPVVFKSNSRSSDAPVLQLQFCDEMFRNATQVAMQVQYDREPSKVFIIPRINQRYVTAAACTMSILKDLWSARTWIEHHRNLGVARFTIYINDLLPKPPSLTPPTLQYVLSQPDVILVEWPFPFKDPNTTRDKVYSPMHYARPLEWNSCNEREHYGAKVTLFNDMDEFVITKYSLIDLSEFYPTTCPAIQLGHYWTRVLCHSNNCKSRYSCPAFDSLEKLQKCQMWRHKDMSLDSRRRTKLIVRTDIRTTHAILNHDLGSPGVKEECKVKSSEIASFFHIINMRPNSK